MEYTIFVPVIFKEDKLQKVNSLLSLIESKVSKQKKIIVGIYTNTFLDEVLINQLKTF